MDEHRPTVSVVVATYKRPDYLNQALDSVYAQTFSDYEVIVADDGSGDEYTSRYNLRPDTKLVCQEIEGRRPKRNRNLATRVARGRYIAYLDDDDLWLPEKLEKQVRILEEHPDAGLTYCHRTMVDDSLQPLASQTAPETYVGNCFAHLIKKNITLPSCVLIRREALDRCGLFDESLTMAEDWEMWTRISLFYSFHGDATPLVLYRVHPDQLTKRPFVQRRWGDVQVVEAIERCVAEHAPAALPDVHKSLAFRLQRLARAEAGAGQHRSALATIRRSIGLRPRDLRSYTTLLQIGIYAMRHCFRASTDRL